ncbi:enoyl-CoA hydratase-related protein [Rhodococcus aetherivorans]|uniref:enoyl-CoA hydratase-related protein n=1 Tax=Rhodococcus TaxID=1827 RepID=UPI00294A496D|nr:enoyl-CoA hydratase-related protein [Rhodococcus aetherivorans]MDV6295307.1 enoyl-CoA hydratase-related protein [Rhodococcus aetherivorans]
MSVVVEQRGRILVVRIEREAKRNAIDRATAEGLDAALNRLDDDPDLWVGIVTGTPTIFSAGTDLSAGVDLRTERGGEYGIIRRERSTPLIAAVEGPALGGGFEIALACDAIIASCTASFGLPETRRGLVATSGALFRAARALPPNIARELLISGRTLGPDRAYQLGLVNEVTEAGNALDRAFALAEDICLSSPMSVRESLRALQALTATEDALGWQVTERAIEVFLASDDMTEGIHAFFENRPPQWRNERATAQVHRACTRPDVADNLVRNHVPR